MKKPPLSVVTPGKTGIQPPQQFGQPGVELWGFVQSQFRIVDCGGVTILTQLCTAADRLEILKSQIDSDGPIIKTKNGPRANPLIREETALRAFICRGLERLGIASEPIKATPGRPGGFAAWSGE